MTMKLYVGNLAFSTSSQDLQELFAAAGTVESASVVEDRDTGRSRGFGFVEMSSKEEGEAAISQFDGKEVGGRALKVNEAKPREPRSGGGGATATRGGRPAARSGGRATPNHENHPGSRRDPQAGRPAGSMGRRRYVFCPFVFFGTFLTDVSINFCSVV